MSHHPELVQPEPVILNSSSCTPELIILMTVDDHALDHIHPWSNLGPR
ncbi:MAG: hypothetical protein AAF456_05570 [Planctomycetota bacterium]